MKRLLITLLVAFSTATTALIRHPLRATLTAFGIFIGVLSFTLVVALGEGAQRSVRAQVEQMGENLLTIRARTDRASGAGESAAKLTEDDALAMSQSVTGVDAVAPTLDSMVRAVAGQNNKNVQAVGSTATYFKAKKYRITEGAVWDKSQENTGARVILVGPTVVTELFGDGPAVGQSVRMGRHLFRIIGILSAKGQSPFGLDLDNIVVMPLRTMRSKIIRAEPGEVGQVEIAGRADVQLETLQKNLRALLRQRHHIKEDQEDDFNIRDQSRITQAQQGVVAVMQMLLTSIALISLFIGGIGVMNIMLVSVTERSREIGTRLAIGATARDVLIQFLIEAVVLSLIGGALGILCAASLMRPLVGVFGWDLWLSSSTAGLGMLVSMTTGVLFGFLPARRAARLDPVVALRRE
ncbi:MAG TPA: ABC transporter permease [Polyangiaceae bacterium]|nr:ABC transporter permease [Polyangiaceae bacterium]